jgi:aspartate aminotransferase-like enzyme
VPDKTYLITPGPTPIPPEVSAAMARPLIHHRSPDFKQLLERTLTGLGRVYATQNPVLMFAGSGTSAMESAVSNMLSPGDRVLVASAGNFGERWVKIITAYGLVPEHLSQAWGEKLDPQRIAARAEDCTAVFVTHSETSTGVVHDVRAIAEALRPTGAALVVDGVSSLGGVELATDAFTPPVTLVAGLDAAIGLLIEEGFEAAWLRNRRLALAAREGAKALGLELFSPDDDSAAMVTAVLMPPDIDGQRVYSLLRDRHGVVLAGGHGALRGRVIRIGHMGYMNEFDIVTALSALEMTLAGLGHRAPAPGAGAARAVAVFGESEPARV